MPLETLKNRSSFLYVREGSKWIAPSLVLQARKRPDIVSQDPDVKNSGSEDIRPRFGFTASKKVGNAVKRNRAKRRLREAVRQLALDKGAKPSRAGYDYVLIARQDTIRLSFDDILRDMHFAFGRVHGKKRHSSRKRK
ncbi:MAG: ribonuclease P protein component [Methyloligellaceae bacterium]